MRGRQTAAAVARAAERRRCFDALRSARRLLVEIRKDEWESYTIRPHKDTPDAWAVMGAGERAAIRRYDRVIAKIDEALGRN